MDNSQTLRRLIFLSTLFVLSSVIAAGVYTRASSQKKQKDPPPPYDASKVTAAPEVRSKVKVLDISGVTLNNQGTAIAAITIDVTNSRDEAVMVLDFTAGKDNYSGLGIDGLLMEEEGPLVIIPPHTLKTFTWSLGEIMGREPVILASAVFADGKEEGDKRSLDGMKITRRHFQQNQRDAKARKGGPQ
jgi:hypothetical protein